MSINVLFDQLKHVSTAVPLVLMGYLNPVLQYGVERFCACAASLGISGVILPDLPLDVYLEVYRPVFEKYNLKNIFLITPQTSEERIRLIDAVSNGFIYMVAAASTTGMKNGIDQEQVAYFDRIKKMQLKNPVLIGFGISDSHSFSKACEFAEGAIVGSAFIKAIEKSQDLEEDILHFTNTILISQLT